MTGGIKDFGKLWEEMREHEDKLEKQVYVKDGSLVVNVEYEYAIELSRLDNHAKILAWVIQLSDKNWMTPEVLQRFVYLAAKVHSLDISQP